MSYLDKLKEQKRKAAEAARKAADAAREKAEKAGDHEKAMKLVNKARQQGIIAVAQAKEQANAAQNN